MINLLIQGKRFPSLVNLIVMRLQRLCDILLVLLLDFGLALAVSIFRRLYVVLNVAVFNVKFLSARLAEELATRNR